MRIRLSALVLLCALLLPIMGCGDKAADTKGADASGKNIGEPKTPPAPPPIPPVPKQN